METLDRAISETPDSLLWKAAFRRAPVALVLILSAALPLRAQKVFLRPDISPDGTNYSGPSGSENPAGRIISLIIDPNNDKILYAASEFAGVWKSTTGVEPGPNGSNTAAKMKWFQASDGLRSGLTQDNTSLAIDKTSGTGTSGSQRLLYATGDDDGRPNTPYGGLWVSTDAAGSWSHVTLCTPGSAGIVSVAFDSPTGAPNSGQPYVSTACGIFTTASANLCPDLLPSIPSPLPPMPGGCWTALPMGSNFPPAGSGGSIVVDGGFGTLFACRGNQVYQATDAGASGNWNMLTVPGACLNLAVVPNGAAASTEVVVTWAQPTNNEVSVVDFRHDTVGPPLGFSSRPNQNLKPEVNAYGSGLPAVATVPIASAPSAPAGPGLTYDVYAADTCAWYAFNPGPPSSWAMLGAEGTECDNPTTLIHADTWAMAFPSWYKAQGSCAAYASTDGGVFFSGGQAPAVGGCADNWGRVQNGLHAVESNAVYAITAGSKPFTSSLTEAVYLPTGDNDVFVTTFGWGKWQFLGDLIGDAGTALVDPGFPNQVVVARNRHYKTVSNPPFPATGAMYTGIIPALPAPEGFDVGIDVGGVSDLAQVMTDAGATPPPTPPTSADYLAVLDQDAKGCSNTQVDVVLRNQSNPPSSAICLTCPPPFAGWRDVSPADHFLACNIAKIQAAGGHADGSLTIYVLTGQGNNKSNPPVTYNPGRGPGQIYRGVVSAAPKTKGLVTRWLSASGSSTQSLNNAVNFFVNPYNPSELYAVDCNPKCCTRESIPVCTPGENAVKVSVDSGMHWNIEPTLTDIATNHGEYRFGCLGYRGARTATTPFANGCSLSGMAFDTFKSNIRVAAMFYGGIAFSRDSGKVGTWMALDVTDNNHLPCFPGPPSPPCLLLSANLTQIAASVFFDGETHGHGKKKKLPIPGPDQHLYAGLKGQGLRMVEGPFLDLESLNFTYTGKTTKTPAQVSVVVLTKGLQQTIPLRSTAGGYQGSLLFDWKTTLPSASVEYHYVGDVPGTKPETFPLTTSEETGGVANVTN